MQHEFETCIWSSTQIRLQSLLNSLTHCRGQLFLAQAVVLRMQKLNCFKKFLFLLLFISPNIIRASVLLITALSCVANRRQQMLFIPFLAGSPSSQLYVVVEVLTAAERHHMTQMENSTSGNFQVLLTQDRWLEAG